MSLPSQSTGQDGGQAGLVLERIRKQGRLAHAILLHGDNLKDLEQTALAVAARMLGGSIEPAKHPDFFTLRPANKMRRIPVDGIRELIRKINQSPNQDGRKVAAIYEADRLQPQAANAFLKTLEEPPTDTTLFLLTTRPYDLMATIRSRCMSVRVESLSHGLDDPEWKAWLADYSAWLENLNQTRPDRKNAAGLVIPLYGLIYRFSAILKKLSSSLWEREKGVQEEVNPNLSDEEWAALEAGVFKSLRQQMFGAIEQATREFALRDLSHLPSRAFCQAIAELEKAAGLLEVNYNETAALEGFLLKSLRLWAKRS